MRQLSGLEASFLHMEDDRVTGHVGGLIVLDPATAEREIDADAIRQHIAERLRHYEAGRRRRAVTRSPHSLAQGDGSYSGAPAAPIIVDAQELPPRPAGLPRGRPA